MEASHDDRLIYKGMHVFPTAIRDLIASKFAGRIEPMLRIWKPSAAQVRFDDPIPIDLEVASGVFEAQFAELIALIEAEVRTQLQVRVKLTLHAPGSLPKGVYRTPLLAVRP